jgi:ribosome-associated protein
MEILKMKDIKINTEFIKLDSFLKWVGAVSLGSEAKMVIQDGMVIVNGEVETRRGKKIIKGDTIEFNGETYTII